MSDALKQVKTIVSSSSLSESDKALILERLENIAPVFTDLLFKALKEDATLLDKLLLSLKDKINASGDAKILEDIALREKDEVLDAIKRKKTYA
jgi:hypothetical protein